MYPFIIQKNEYLSRDVPAFYHTDYLGYQKEGNPDYINVLKNTFREKSTIELCDAAKTLSDTLREDLPKILQSTQKVLLTVCVIPRAKKTHTYSPDQLRFRHTVSDVVKELGEKWIDGTGYIERHTDTKTTHLKNSSLPNDGKEPYPGITAETCDISDEVKGKDILLIDDVYTKAVNIGEDVIQALLDKGARSVYLYAVGRTSHEEGL
jgi:phosphoribosylpyrophosphate synthetase